MVESDIDIYKTIFNEMPGLQFWKDVNSVYRMINKGGCRLAGFKSSIEIEGKTDHDLPWACYADNIQQMDQHVLQNEYMVYVEPIKIFNNTEFTLLTRKKQIKDERGKIIGLLGHSTIISDPKLLKSTNLLMQTDFESFGVYPSCYNIKKAFHSLTNVESICFFYHIRGKTSNEIAKIISLSKRTVEAHLANIKFKLNCKNKSELIAKAFSHGYIYIIPENCLR